ncbi:hypothetical protein [Kocuria palustris]|uniref:hypothetical protein n=1 Tax=Kocuria palustris TaxID=71999 RepID=UPI002043CDCD|nr:hypothetical protein [Kocuria palustris]MCM3332807.1 hypothetical protein [Kocuria palustris]
MTETTTTRRRFTELADFAAEAQPGDTLHLEEKTTMTTAVAVRVDDGAGPQGQRTVTFDYLITLHKGSPGYCYVSRRHTQTAWISGQTYNVDLNMGQPMTTIHRVTGVKRRSAKGLASAHAEALALTELTA